MKDGEVLEMLLSVYDFLIVFMDSQPLWLFTQNQASKNSSMGEEGMWQLHQKKGMSGLDS